MKKAGRIVLFALAWALFPASDANALSSLPDGAIGVPYQSQLGPNTYWALTGGALPTGLTLNNYTGVISGVPTALGVFIFDLNSGSDFKIAILPPLAITSPAILAPVTVGGSYAVALQASNGTPPYTWFSPQSLAGPGFPPPGIRLGGSGALTGVPTTAGTFGFGATVADSSKASPQHATAEFAITVNPPPTTSPGPLATGFVGQLYSQRLPLTGGTGPYEWVVTGGSLPPGISLSIDGSLAGTPVTPGVYRFNLRVRDTYSIVSSGEFSITIVPAVSLLTASLPDGSVGSAYSQPLLATGGTTPYTWSVDSGILPPGLALDTASGAISGTPTTTGTSSFTVRVIDVRQTTSTSALQLKVVAPALPPASLPGIPETLPPAEQNDVQVHLASPYPLLITGTMNLAFAPGVPNGDDPAVQFSSGNRSVAFTIPAGKTEAVFSDTGVGVQTGTVAGVITLTVQLVVEDVDLTPTPAPTHTITIPPAVPLIKNVTVTRTASGIEVSVTGYSNTRDMATASFTFPQASGTNFISTTIDLPASGLFSPYYADEGSIQFGSNFTYVQPFTIQGTATDIQQVGVVLKNSVGASAPMTKAIQ